MDNSQNPADPDLKRRTLLVGGGFAAQALAVPLESVTGYLDNLIEPGEYPILPGEQGVLNTDVAYDQFFRWVPKHLWPGLVEGTDTGFRADQALFDAAISWSRRNRKGKLPRGRFRVSGTWHLWAKNHAPFAVEIEGYGGQCTLGGPSAHYNTWIDGSAIVDRPVINIEMARGVRLKGLVVSGGNTAPRAVGTWSVSAERSDYISAACSSGQYNAQCGICIDAYASKRPLLAGAYPETELYSRHNGNGSFDVALEDITVQDCVVGFLDSPSMTNALGDFISLRDFRINNCAAAFGFGNSNTFSVFFDGINGASKCHTLCDTESFGHRNGHLPRFEKIDCSYTYQLFTCARVAGGQGGLRDSYAEGIVTLGCIGNYGSNNNDDGGSSYKFERCKLLFYSDPTRGKRAHVLLESMAQILFDSCDIGLRDPVFSFIGRRNGYHFQNCSFSVHGSVAPDAFPLPLVYIAGNTVALTQQSLYFKTNRHGSESGPWDFLSSDVPRNLPTDTFAIDGAYPVPSRYTHSVGTPGHRCLIEQVPDLEVPARKIALDAGLLSFITTPDAAASLQVLDVLLWQARSMAGSNPAAAGKAGKPMMFPAFRIAAIDLASGEVSARALADTQTYYDTHYRPTVITALMQAQWLPETAAITTAEGSITAVVEEELAQRLIERGPVLMSKGLAPYTRMLNRKGGRITLSRAAVASGTFALYGCRVVRLGDAPAIR